MRTQTGSVQRLVSVVIAWAMLAVASRARAEDAPPAPAPSAKTPPTPAAGEPTAAVAPSAAFPEAPATSPSSREEPTATPPPAPAIAPPPTTSLPAPPPTQPPTPLAPPDAPYHWNEAPPPPPAPSDPLAFPARGFAFDGSIGGASSGIQVGTTALYLEHWFEAGVGITAREGIFGGNSTLATILAGGRVDTASGHLRFEGLAEFGEHTFSDVGSDLFSRAQDSRSYSVPYLGFRIGVSTLIGRSSGFVLGLVMQSGRDLERRTVVVPVQTCFLGCSTNDESYVVGGTSSSVVLRIGGQFGIH